jgi:hypothetical protein
MHKISKTPATIKSETIKVYYANIGEWFESCSSPEPTTCHLHMLETTRYLHTTYLLHLHSLPAVFFGWFFCFDCVGSGVLVLEVPVWVLGFVVCQQGWNLIGWLEVAADCSPGRALVFAYYVWKVVLQQNEKWSMPQMPIEECQFLVRWGMPNNENWRASQMSSGYPTFWYI